MSTGTPDSPMTACPNCPCPQLDRFWEHVQQSEWSQVRELLDHMDGCGHWLKVVSAGAAADQQVDWVHHLSEDFPLQRTSGLFRELRVNNRWSAVLDLCTAGSLCDDLKGLLVMGFIRHGLGDLSLHYLKRESVSDSQPLDWRQEYVIKFTMTEYFQHQSPKIKRIFINLFPCKYDPATSPLFREAVTKCIELDNADCFLAVCSRLCESVEPETQEMVSDDVLFAYSAATEQPHFISKLDRIKCLFYSKYWCEKAMNQLYQQLWKTVMKKQAWSVMPVLFSAPLCPCKAELWRKCLHKMLSDQELWPGMAPALDQWALEIDLRHMKVKFAEEHRPSSMSSLKQWCVDTGHARLAFLLAFVTKDVVLLGMVVTTFTSMYLPLYHLHPVLELCVDNGMISSIVAMLKTNPVNAKNVGSCRLLDRSVCLVAACEREGLVDWALVLRRNNLAYVRQHVPCCQNLAVPGVLLKETASLLRLNWDIVRELMGRCNEENILRVVLWRAACNGQVDIVESLLSRVDPSAYDGNRTLLFAVCTQRYHIEPQLNIACLCVASGLSTFQRNTELTALFPRCSIHVCLRTGNRTAFSLGKPDMAKLTIAAGTYSKKYLYDRATEAERCLQLVSSDDPKFPDLETTCRVILEAASTPCRLNHLARLVVSHCIGCRPGRSDRIHSLPLPSSLKDMLSFKDVLESG